MSTRDAFIAVHRFGLGPRPGELDQAATDPKAFLVRQIGPATAAPPAEFAGLPSGAERMGDFLHFRRERRDDPAAAKEFRTSFRDTYMREASARLTVQVTSAAPFRERLVAFWSNHFTVSVQRPVVFGTAGAFEREAIRPYVTGRFSDMLMAVARHPAMLAYLDNGQSFGPGSLIGLRQHRGLNENLAREMLELHTLGVDGGYTQTDVRELAKILTGWTVTPPRFPDAGQFRFFPQIHEPGSKTLLGAVYPEGGEMEALAVFQALTRHPATAHHIATKLARHFIADNPPPAAVARLARIFSTTHGDLGAVSAALIEQPEAWENPLAKVKTPNEFVVAALRATGFTPQSADEGHGKMMVNAVRLLGQAPFNAPSPAGWPDTAADWISPESVLRRADWAMTLAERMAPGREAERLFEATIAPVAAPATAKTVARAPSRADAMGLVLASAEFQRR
jgi:uncharacterized protein (DUF1800 family)